MRVGAHVSIAGGVDNAVERQRAVGGSCGQIFTTSPQVWRDPSITEEEAAGFREAAAAEEIGPWVVHASYLVNLATPKDDLREKSIASLQADIDAAAELGIEYVNVHLGAHTGAGVEQGLANAASALDALDVPTDVRVLVETDAGGGTKLGDGFDQLATVLNRSEQDLGVCLDTAHAFAA
ncbi:endonuclease IV, partial [Halobacteriales archaeon QH_10_67_13]